jgi:hypothetical protein
MLVIGDVLISEEILKESFQCNVEKCKGACCWEGDYGAPLTEEEIIILDNIQDQVMPRIPEKSREVLQNSPGYVYEKKPATWATKCHEDGACIYLHKDPATGIAQCGIELAFQNGETTFQKPISCHLYPIRVTKNRDLGFEAWNYDRWDICTAACSLGEENKMPVFRFVKNAIIRDKGQEFYEQLEEAYNYYREQNQPSTH